MLTVCLVCIIITNTKEASKCSFPGLASKTPIYMQIRDQVVLGIAGGELAPGEKLPTIRALAGSAAYT